MGREKRVTCKAHTQCEASVQWENVSGRNTSADGL